MTTPSPKGAASPQQVQAAKALLTSVLSSPDSLQNNPALEADDVLSMQVAIVEAADAAWLEAQLKNERHDPHARLTVALQTRGPMRKPLLKALGAPAFLL